MKIPTVSLWQPWSSLIGHGKRLETRHWETHHRGMLAIHAAMRFDKECQAICRSGLFLDHLQKAGYKQPFKATLPFGKIVSIVNLTEIIETDKISVSLIDGDEDHYNWSGDRFYISSPEFAFGNYTHGRYAWKLDDIYTLSEPIPAKGRQGIFYTEIPDDICYATGIPIPYQKPVYEQYVLNL